MASMRKEIFCGLGLIAVLLLVLAGLLYKRIAGVSPFARDVAVRTPIKPIQRDPSEPEAQAPEHGPMHEQVSWNSEELGEFGAEPAKPAEEPATPAMTLPTEEEEPQSKIDGEQKSSAEQSLDLLQNEVNAAAPETANEPEQQVKAQPAPSDDQFSSRKPLRARQPAAAIATSGEMPSETRQAADWSDENVEYPPPSEYGNAGNSQEVQPGDPTAQPSAPVALENGKYSVQPNDNYYTIAEKVYGNSGYFRAIQEHNRSRFPRPDKLQVGDLIDAPSAEVLEQRYPSLCPKARKVPPARQTLMSASARQKMGDRVYVVGEGDTLFDIARYELGKASRWVEIYDLNRDVLGEDFDYLRPGTELVVPTTRRETDAVTRQGKPAYQR